MIIAFQKTIAKIKFSRSGTGISQVHKNKNDREMQVYFTKLMEANFDYIEKISLRSFPSFNFYTTFTMFTIEAKQ